MLLAGVEHPKFSAPQDLQAYDKQGPYKTMAEAAGDHGGQLKVCVLRVEALWKRSWPSSWRQSLVGTLS